MSAVAPDGAILQPESKDMGNRRQRQEIIRCSGESSQTAKHTTSAEQEVSHRPTDCLSPDEMQVQPSTFSLAEL